ncbi:MAG: hypothetical protein ACYDC1_11305 [Limisphaerales bacterium]
MKNPLASLNLSPAERRILGGIALVVFLIVNAVFVWPQFGDWTRQERQLAASRHTLKTYQAEIALAPANQARLAKLEQLGSAVLPAEQALQLTRTIQERAQQASLTITGTRVVGAPGTGGAATNLYFDEQTVSIDTASTDQELVDFLVGIGASDSMIRVRSLELKPDPPKYKLIGKVELLASYQKKPKSVTPPAPRAGATGPVTNVASKTL